MRLAGAALCFASVSAGVQAQEAGDLVLATGLFHIHPSSDGGRIRTHLRPGVATEVLGVPETFDAPGASLRSNTNDTVGFTGVYFLTKNWGVALDAGLPPTFEIEGSGAVAPPGVSGAVFSVNVGDPDVNPLGSARQWSPAVLLQFRAGNDQHWWPRPYASVGVTYLWFTQVDPSKAFAAEVDRRLGQPLALAAGKPGRTSLSADLDEAWAPVFNGGLSFALTNQWALTMSASYIPLRLTTTLESRAQDGSLLARTRGRFAVDPVVTALLLNYTW